LKIVIKEAIADIALASKEEISLRLKEEFPEAKALTFWKLQSFTVCYNLIRENLKRLLDFPFGDFDVSECADAILGMYSRKLQDTLDYDEEISLPFGEVGDWLLLVEGFVRMSAGIPSTYIEAYNKLILCKMKAINNNK